MLHFTSNGFWRYQGPFGRGPQGPGEVKIEFFFKILDGLEQTLQATPHMAPFASIEKSRFFGGPWGPFGGVPGDQVRSKSNFFFKILNGLEQTLQATPHMAPLASLEKSRFSEVPGAPSAGSLGTR